MSPACAPGPPPARRPPLRLRRKVFPAAAGGPRRYGLCGLGEQARAAGDIDDPDWIAGSIQRRKVIKPNSVYNNGSPGGYDDVVFYRQPNYVDRIGCTRNGAQGNLAGTYQIRSHKWVTSC